MDLDRYLDALASSAPTPGGGSAAAIVGALGAALVAMVARITLEAPRLSGVHADASTIASEADALRREFDAARPADESAYAAVVAAQALPRGTDAEKALRTERLQASLAHAADVPLNAAELSARAMHLAARAAALENRHLMSDVECAVAFFRAAFEASAANVRVNHAFLKSDELIAAQAARLNAAGATLAEAERRAALHFAG